MSNMKVRLTLSAHHKARLAMAHAEEARAYLGRLVAALTPEELQQYHLAVTDDEQRLADPEGWLEKMREEQPNG